MLVNRLALTPPDQRPVFSVGFAARSLLVENPTNAYWFLPDQGRFIPPFVSGMVIPLGDSGGGTESVKILYQAPTGLQQPATLVTPGAAFFTFVQRDMNADSGLSLSANAFGRGVSLIPVGFTTPQTLFTFVQPAPDGFVIMPTTSDAGPGLNLRASLDIGGTGLNFLNIFAQASMAKNVSGFYAPIPYRRLVPVQSVLALSGSGLNAILLI